MMHRRIHIICVFRIKWTVTKKIPQELDTALAKAIDENNVDLIRQPGGYVGQALAKGVMPTFFVSTSPVELIVTQGEPNIASIPGTNVMWVSNTSSDVLIDASQQFYFLTSGRWFKAATLEGPWQYVPGKDLPADFKNIPVTHPRGAVLASIPGTPQAKESLIANSIPQTATIKKSAAKFKPIFDGEPKFEPIEGTNMKYAKNSPTPIIDVPGNTFYAVDNGAWFKANNINDQWIVADSVPSAVYTIPPSSPVYYATYVQSYGGSDDEAYFSYTPGYYGTVVSDDTVVYGTGYTYQPWVGAAWYGAPATYGCGVAFGYNPAFGWTFGFDDARPLASPWWGPVAWGWNGNSVARWNWHGYDSWGGVNTANVYHRWGDNVYKGAHGVAWSNPWTGNIGVARRGAAYNPATGRYAAGGQAAVYNTRTGGYAAGERGVAGNAYIGSQVAGQRGTVSPGAARTANDLYADPSGQIYRNTGGQNFQHLDQSGSWQNAQADRNLAAENSVRTNSAMRENSFNAAGSRGFGGGFRGGGRR